MMGRHRSISIIFAGLGLVLAMPVALAQNYHLKISDYLPPQHGINADFLKPWSRHVAACANHKVDFTIYPGGTPMGNVAKQQEQVLSGVTDISVGLTGIPRGRFPATTIISMPFLVKKASVGSQVLWDLFPKYLSRQYKGLKVLALFTHNGGLIHTAHTKITSVKDMRGLRLRTPSPVMSKMLSTLGATPVTMPPSQVYQAIQKGVINGTVFPWDPVHSFGLNEVLHDHLDAKAYVVSFYFVMNQRKYRSLPKKIRSCINRYSGQTLIDKFGRWWNKWDSEGRQQAIKQGDTITHLSDQQRNHWRKLLQPMIHKYLAAMNQKNNGVNNAFKIYHAMQAEVAKYNKDHNLAKKQPKNKRTWQHP